MPGQLREDFGREKSDLALVIVPIIVKTIAANSVTRDALDPRNLDQRIVIGRLSVMPEIIVAG